LQVVVEAAEGLVSDPGIYRYFNEEVSSTLVVDDL